MSVTNIHSPKAGGATERVALDRVRTFTYHNFTKGALFLLYTDTVTLSDVQTLISGTRRQNHAFRTNSPNNNTSKLQQTSPPSCRYTHLLRLLGRQKLSVIPLLRHRAKKDRCLPYNAQFYLLLKHGLSASFSGCWTVNPTAPTRIFIHFCVPPFACTYL